MDAALALLPLLVAQDQATVYTRPYTPEGERPRWNVWDMTAGTGRRVELEPWARGVLAQQTPLEAPPTRTLRGPSESDRLECLHTESAARRMGLTSRAIASPGENMTPSLLDGPVIVSPDGGAAAENGNYDDHGSDDQSGQQEPECARIQLS